MRGTNSTLFGLSLTVALVTVLFAASAGAMRFTSTDYIIDTAVLNNVGGDSSSSSYQLTSSGGEAAIGDGAGGSYKLAAGYVAQIITEGTPAMTVTTQPKGLVAYYPMDEGTGTIVHDDVSNNYGTIEGAADWYSSGQIGASMDMSAGGDGDVRVPYNSALPSGQAMTIEAWIRPSASAATQMCIVCQWTYGGSPQNGAWAWQTTQAGTGLRFFLVKDNSDGGNNYVDTVDGLLTFSTWQQVVLVYDGTQANNSDRIKMYVNGALASSTTNGTINSSINPNTADLTIGTFPGLPRYFHGAMDEVKLFDRALGADEIKAEYNAQNVGVPTGLSLGLLVPGASNSSDFDTIVKTTGSGYTLAINQDHGLQSGTNFIPSISADIASPVSWNEGTTKGLGFTVVSSTATAPSASWSSGSAYAALPSTATSFYTRSGTQSSSDVIAMRLRADVMTDQVSGNYTNQMIVTGTTNP